MLKESDDGVIFLWHFIGRILFALITRLKSRSSQRPWEGSKWLSIHTCRAVNHCCTDYGGLKNACLVLVQVSPNWASKTHNFLADSLSFVLIKIWLVGPWVTSGWDSVPGKTKAFIRRLKFSDANQTTTEGKGSGKEVNHQWSVIRSAVTIPLWQGWESL